jgi:signal transduction histidine kinase
MFRLKIALLSVLLSGLVLMGLGFYSLSMLNKVNLERIDREILSLGEGQLVAGPPRGYWQNFEESLRFIYREGSAANVVVMIKDPGDEVLYKSAQWPEEVTEAAFPAFDRTMEPRPPVAGDLVLEERLGGARRPGGSPNDAASGERRGPPPEAYLACEGKSPGSVAQFVNQRGEALRGTCQWEGTRLVLRPDHRREERPGQARDANLERPAPPAKPADRTTKPPPRMKKPCLASIPTASGVWRTGIMGSERITMLVGVNLAGYYADAERYRRAFLGIVPLAMLLLAAGGWLLAARALKPVALITRTAEGITARGLGQRIPPVVADRELARLVEVINTMLARLEKSFGQALRFSADAAHELQTPLTILQGELDEAVQHAPVGSAEQRRYSGLLEEVQRLKAIVQKLLILARADAGRLELQLQPLDLSSMLESAAEDAGALAPQLKVETQIAPGVMVKADSELLGQVISNLTSNGVKYNRENGLIRFTLSVRNRQACLTIANTGTPVPAQARERIFDRFYRVDQARSKAVPGSGLGLSLAREIVLAHGGELRLDLGTGPMVSFTLMLPVAA